MYRGPLFKGAFPLCIDRILGPDTPQPPRTGGQTGGGIGEETPSGGLKPSRSQDAMHCAGRSSAQPIQISLQNDSLAMAQRMCGWGWGCYGTPCPPPQKKHANPKQNPCQFSPKKNWRIRLPIKIKPFERKKINKRPP